MKIGKKLISALLIVIMLMSVAPLGGLDLITESSALEASGKCGTNVTYTFKSSTGLLTISGTGAMTNYSSTNSPFYNNSSIKTVVIEEGVTSIGEMAFYYCTGLTSVTIPDSVINIGDGAFGQCTGLTSVTIPDSVTSMGNYAFCFCTGLTSVTIPDSVTNIGDGAFGQCTGLTSVTIPDSITSIGEGTFNYCTGLTSVTIPDSVINIGVCAFNECIGLASITIPDSVTSIGEWAFDECTGLKDVYYTGTEAQWNKITISLYNDDLTNATIHYNSTSDTTKPTGSISSTNNVATSQTVTLSLSDNVGVAGYYWGTSSTYSSNTYTSTNSSSVTKTVSSAGTYYLTVKDTSGNVSSNYSIIFYKTTLNANGGSVSPTSVITQSGNSFTFPTPTKSGYTYSGWSTSSSATSGVTTLKPTSNTTYYAAWTYNDTTKPTGSISSTNNVATSQTVTLSLSDNVGVAGYYWGTSSTYSSNTYTSTNSSSVTKTVSSAGTYYLTVKDTSGNVSSNYSIIFYKTTLNANGGSVSPTSVITQSGNSFTFPTPTKSGYTYSGWSTSSSATSGVTTLKPTSNTTYYAAWTYNDTTKPTGSISSTNNVATSQTVTLSLSDNVGVAGYYWGTSSTYSSNTYTSTSGSSDTKTVSSAGTYYLTVKDTSGNVSSNYSITFYKTTLNANGGSVSPASVITQSGNSFTFPTPTKSGYTYSGWSTSSSATSGVTTLKPTSNTTYYVVWENTNIYNLGEETYSFKNFGDSDSYYGHCFGMSATSSGYYIGKLNPSSIGISSAQDLHTLNKTSTVTTNICKYQAIQGSRYSTASIVAGGSSYITGVSNISSDWNAVINYVKDHSYDSKGLLQIGYRGADGGHAINFLRYEVVNGQERIYAYDNNFPDIETYFCKGSDGKVYQKPKSTFSSNITCICLRDMNTYFSKVADYDSSRYIYGYENVIAVENATAYPMEIDADYDEALGEFMMFEINDGVDSVKITPLTDNALFIYCDEQYVFSNVDESMEGTLILSDTGSSDDTSLVVKTDKFNIANISKYNNKTVDYKTSITFHANTENVSFDNIVWYVNGNKAGVGESYSVSNATGNYSIFFTAKDANGNTISSETENIKVNTGIFAKLVAFFKGLFNSLPVFDQ